MLEAAIGLIVGIVLSMIFTWKMALITLAVSPLVALGGVMMSRLQWKGRNGKVKEDE